MNLLLEGYRLTQDPQELPKPIQIPAAIPWAVDLIFVGKSSVGRMNVGVFGPMFPNRYDTPKTITKVKKLSSKDYMHSLRKYLIFVLGTTISWFIFDMAL